MLKSQKAKIWWEYPSMNEQENREAEKQTALIRKNRREREISSRNKSIKFLNCCVSCCRERKKNKQQVGNST
jgi:hypothetical protein